jgi:hypothetical protein
MVPEGATVVEDGEVDIVKTVTAAALVLTPVLASVAAMVWLPDCDGAVYRPVVLITPTEEFPPAMLSTDHVVEGFVVGKLALNCCVAPAMSVAVAGDTELVLVTVTAELALFVVSATLVAVTVCAPATSGALYKPVASINPLAALPPTTESTDHVTALFVVPVTLAVNCIVAPTATLTEDC